MKNWLRYALAGAAVAGFGTLRLPLEHQFDRVRRLSGLRDDADVRLTLREQAGQSALVAVLGGLRSLVAALWDLRAHEAWHKTRYGEVERDYRFAQQLQPRVFYYWDMGQWMMATNAASFYRYNESERRGLGDVLYDSYVEKGRSMIEAGMRNLPDDWRIYQSLARLYQDRYRTRDYEKIAAAWGKAASFPDALAYTRRAHAFSMAQIPGREDEARSLLTVLHDESPKHRVPTLLTLLSIFRAADEAPSTPNPAALHARLRTIYDREFPLTRTPLLVRTIRVLESRLDLPPAQRLPPDAEKTTGQRPPDLIR